MWCVHVCGRVHAYKVLVATCMRIWVLCGMGVGGWGWVQIQSVGGSAIVKVKNELLGQAVGLGRLQPCNHLFT